MQAWPQPWSPKKWVYRPPSSFPLPLLSWLFRDSRIRGQLSRFQARWTNTSVGFCGPRYAILSRCRQRRGYNVFFPLRFGMMPMLKLSDWPKQKGLHMFPHLITHCSGISRFPLNSILSQIVHPNLPSLFKPAQAGPCQYDCWGCSLPGTWCETWSCGDLCGWRRPPLWRGPGPPGRRLDRRTHRCHGDRRRRLFQRCS